MKKHIKGFTLIECLVALAVLGVASLTMAQIYASVARRNMNNHLVNTSLSNQMAYVEKYTDSEAVTVYYGHATQKKDDNMPTPPHEATTPTNYNFVKITKLDSSGNPVSGEVYSFPADLYVLYSRDGSDTQFDSTKEKDINLRYRYLKGHTKT